MAFHLYEDTWETTTTTGTGAYTLAGAVTGWRTFSAQYADGDTTWYSVLDGTNFEHGIGTYHTSANTLSRTTVLRSTNSNAAVSWSAGTRQITVAPLGAVLETMNAPYFMGSMYAGNLSVSPGTWTKCVIDSAQQDSHGWWNSTLTRYLPLRAGRYHVIYECVLGSSTGAQHYGASIYMDGGPFFYRDEFWNGTNTLPGQTVITCSIILNCDGATNYIEPYALVDGATSPKIVGGGENQLIITYLGP